MFNLKRWWQQKKYGYITSYLEKCSIRAERDEKTILNITIDHARLGNMLLARPYSLYVPCKGADVRIYIDCPEIN